MRTTSRRRFFNECSAAMAVAASSVATRVHAQDRRPNILFAIADDWSWPHASAYGAKGVDTPAFDRIAAEGCLFSSAFTAAPQCSPNRAATLTGRHIWQIEEAGTHGSIFPKKHPVFTDLLEGAGYHVGYTGKPWGPGDWKRGGWPRNPAGPEYNKRRPKSVPAKGIRRTDYADNFADFLEDRPKSAPFCFWYGASEPHRSYERGSGVKAGKRLADVAVPGFLPDDPEVRGDILDYFLEVEWFDTQLGRMLEQLEALGELDNTLVVATGDNGMPFPRAKANLYEFGTRVPLAIRWPERIRPGRTTDALFGFIDFAPTFLEAAGLEPPPEMTGKSFAKFLASDGTASPHEFVQTGRERHTHARFDNLGYPCRALRSADYLYIRNMKPDRWPAGDPEAYHDIDGSPSKTLLLENTERYGSFLELAVGKRPGDELFNIKTDPDCLHNLAADPEHRTALDALRTELDTLLTGQGDPRMLGTGDIFESYPRVSSMRPQLGGFAERGEYNPKYRNKRGQ